MVKIKICGITTLEDLFLVDGYNPDFLGFIMYPLSPRYVGPKLAELLKVKTTAKKVVVFVNPPYEDLKRALNLGADYLQLHGEEDPTLVKKIGPKRVIKAFRVRDDFPLGLLKPFAEVYALLLDAYREKVPGGTGRTFNWKIAKEAVREGYRIFLAGGLNPGNIVSAIKEVNPFGVDLSSGLELSPGKKDPLKVEKLFQILKTL